MKKIRNLLSVFLAVTMIFSMFSVFCITVSAENTFSVEAEAIQKADDRRIEVAVYGYNMKGIDGLDVVVYADKSQAEYIDYRFDLTNAMSVPMELSDGRSGVWGSMRFEKELDTDEKIRLMTCWFYPLERGSIDICLETKGDLEIEGQTVFAVDTSDMIITYYSDEYVYTVREDTVAIIEALDVVGETGIVTIPSEIDGLPVTDIKDKSFENTEYMIGVIIPESVDMVGSDAFKNSYSLEWIEVQSWLTSFRTDAFDGLRSHVAVFGPDNAFAKEAADFSELRYFSEKTEVGDINADGRITAADARLTLRISSRVEPVCVRADAYADIDNNGSVTAADARLILRTAAKLY